MAVLAAYVAIFGTLIVANDFLPYVMDNNESFSSLWHAYSLYQFGISDSWGLADEAFSPHAAAHPYVHTHQGNFPRLFAFAIYLLGARSIESQILVTTVTAGLVSIVLVYSYFSSIAPRPFAALVCAVLMTDYVLFAQWQVVTYRVWYVFLLFACLLSTHRLAEGWTRPRAAWTAAAFWSLFYFELVFAAFVGAFCAVYLTYRAGRRPRRVIGVLAVQAVSGAVALGVVMVQAAGYLGWSDFVQDIYLTFIARNDSSSVSVVEQIARFYESRHVIFWHNLQDRKAFSGLEALLHSFTHYDWSVHTPLFSTTIGVLTFGWLIALAPRSASIGPRTFAVMVFVALAGCAILVPHEVGLYNADTILVWDKLQGMIGPREVEPFVYILAALVAAWLVLDQCRGALGHDPGSQLREVVVYLACGGLAYALVFQLSPGYIFSGYLVRSAPLTVFFTDVVVAVGLYIAIRAALVLTRFAIHDTGGEFRLYRRSSMAAAAALLALGLPAYWFAMQVNYVQWLRPDHYAFVKNLDKPPYRGASFVANGYAAPIAAFTGQWAYFDPGISQAYLVESGAGHRLAGDRKYLWFADRATNPAYRRPDFFICIMGQSMGSVVNRVMRDRLPGYIEPSCSSLPLVQLARKGDVPGITLADYDRAGDVAGADTWAIVRFDWTAPLELDWELGDLMKKSGRP